MFPQGSAAPSVLVGLQGWGQAGKAVSHADLMGAVCLLQGWPCTVRFSGSLHVANLSWLLTQEGILRAW